jgi:hypothetical protein
MTETHNIEYKQSWHDDCFNGGTRGSTTGGTK